MKNYAKVGKRPGKPSFRTPSRQLAKRPTRKPQRGLR